MKIFQIIVILTLYYATVGYLLFRMMKIFSKEGLFFKAACGFFGVMSFFFSCVLILRAFNMGGWFLPFQTISYVWMVFVLYFCLMVFFIDVLSRIVFLFPTLRRRFEPYVYWVRKCYVWLSAFASCVLVGYGLFHFQNPEIKELTIEMDKPVPDWTVVAVSDLHLGTMSVDMLKKHVDKINSLHPDVVLMLGDQFEVNWREVIPWGYASILRQIQAPHGVYAVNGNHEELHEFSHNFDSRVSFLYNYMKIKLLDDYVVVLDDKLALIGRADSSRSYARMPLSLLMEEIPDNTATILLDHQPADLSQAQSCGVDLQLSGHMHDGQVFPMNLWQRFKASLNGKLYCGYARNRGTQYYVTSGLGASGAPIRIGTSGEIVVLHLKQKK